MGFFFFNFHVAGRQSSLSVVAKATGESSESSTTLSIVKSVQNVVSFPQLSLTHADAGFYSFLLYNYLRKIKTKE